MFNPNTKIFSTVIIKNSNIKLQISILEKSTRKYPVTKPMEYVNMEVAKVDLYAHVPRNFAIRQQFV